MDLYFFDLDKTLYTYDFRFRLPELARLSGADPIYTFDCFGWRTAAAKAMGATEAYNVSPDVDVAYLLPGRHARC